MDTGIIGKLTAPKPTFCYLLIGLVIYLFSSITFASKELSTNAELKHSVQTEQILPTLAIEPVTSFEKYHDSPLTLSLDNHAFFDGMFVGLMVILSFINLTFYIVLRLKSQLFLSLSLYNLLVAYGLYSGILLSVVPSALAPFIKAIFVLHAALGCIALFVYCEHLLKNSSTLVWNTIKTVVMGYWGVTSLVVFFASPALGLWLSAIGALLTVYLCLHLNFTAWFKKQRQARFIVIGLACLLGGITLELLAINGFISSNIWPTTLFNGQQSILLMALLLTFATIDTIRLNQQKDLKDKQNLIETEKQFVQVFEQAYQMLFIISPEQKIQAINTPVELFTQKKREQLINTDFCNTFITLKDNLDKEQIKEKFEEALTGAIVELNVIAYTGQRSMRDLEISFQPFFSEDGELANIIAQVRDITEQTQAFNAIQDMVVGVASLSADNFFRHLVNEVSRIYKAKFVLISLLNNTSPKTATSIILAENKTVIPNITYALKGSPSESLLTKHICNYPDRVCNIFPDDEWLSTNNIRSYLGVNIKNNDDQVIGFLTVMDCKPMNEDNYFIEVLDVFASRVAAELQQQSSQKELKKALERLDFHISNTPLGVIEWDGNFDVINWNKAAERIFGFSQSAFLGKDPLEVLVPQDEIPEIKRLTEELVANKVGQYSLNSNLTKDGRTILCEWYNTPLLDSENNVIGVASLVNDVTAEHEALNALYLKENEQREIFNALVDAIFIVSDQGCILTINNASTVLFEYTQEELIGQSFVLLLPESQRDFLHTFIQSEFVHNPDKQGVGKEIEVVKKSGEAFPCYLTLAELPHSAISDKRYIVACHDLTVFKQQQETIRQTQKMDALGNLTGGIAHDFNNLLGIINGYSELLRGSLSESDKLTKYAMQIQKASTRGAKLTQKLLSFARKNTIESESANINEILIDEFEMLQKTITPRIDLTYQLDDSLPVTKIDVEEFEDCLLNLTINAMHAIDKQGEITIKTELKQLDGREADSINLPADKYIIVSITDTGKGMDEPTLRQATDPFFSTKGDSGTGLGLSQVYGFVERSEGRLVIQSKVDEGTSVAMVFPIKAESTINQAPSKEPIALGDLEGDILVVDDEAALAELASTILEEVGFTVVAVNSGAEALNQIAKRNFDLVLCDIIMPNMDGVTLAEKVKHINPDIPFLFASGYHEYELNAQNQITSQVMKKPYSALELISQVRNTMVAQDQRV